MCTSAAVCRSKVYVMQCVQAAVCAKYAVALRRRAVTALDRVTCYAGMRVDMMHTTRIASRSRAGGIHDSTRCSQQQRSSLNFALRVNFDQLGPAHLPVRHRRVQPNQLAALPGSLVLLTQEAASDYIAGINSAKVGLSMNALVTSVPVRLLPDRLLVCGRDSDTAASCERSVFHEMLQLQSCNHTRALSACRYPACAG